MHLERLEISGFKSFSDRSELAFDRGVTAIVGPNGCGKSNVADALTWVLGEQSAKSLRGDRMEDVIFSGSDARKPTGAAEVRLRLSDVIVPPSLLRRGGSSTFAPDASADKSDPPPGEDVPDHDPSANGNGHHPELAEILVAATREVDITRRLYRSGESEYLIDGQTCRLKDIHELLMDTGLGQKAYAIIEQGKIGMILSSRPTDRRQLIEEAAGITKYKARRRSAELKLEAAQQNLTRLDDIVFEIDKQRGSLKRQAAKARRYTRLRDEMRRWEKVLFARRYRTLAEAIDAARARLHDARTNEGVASARLAEVENELARIRIELVSADEAATMAREAVHGHELEINRRQQQIALDAQQAGMLQARAEELDLERQQLEARREPERLALQGRREAATDAERAGDDASALVAAASDAYTRAQQAIESVEQEVDNARADVYAVLNTVTALNAAVESASAQRERAVEALGRLDQEARELAAELDKAQAQRQAAADALRRALDGLDAAKISRAARESELAGARAEHEWRSRDVRSREQDLVAMTARLHSLEEIDTHRSGFADAARLVLVNANGKVGQMGAVADFIEVEPKYERAVEACMGDLLQHVLVERLEHVSAGLQLIRQEDAGRCGFVVGRPDGSTEVHSGVPHGGSFRRFLTGVPTGVQTEVPAAVPPGAIALSSVVQIGGPFPHAIQAVMAGALIADSFETAARIAPTVPYPVATLEGDVFRGRHVVTGGEKVESRGILATKREIKELREKIAASRAALDQLIADTAGFEQTIAHATTAIAGLSAEFHRQEKAIVGVEGQSERAAADEFRLRQHNELVATEISRVREEIAGLDARLQEATESIARLGEQKATADHALGEAQRRLSDARDTAEGLSQKAAEARAAHAGLVERCAGALAEVARMEDAAAELERRVQACGRDVALMRDQRERLLQAVAEGQRQMDADVGRLEGLRGDLVRADDAALEIKQASERQEEVIRDARRAVDALRALAAEVDVQRATAESDLTHLAQQSIDTVNATLDDIREQVAQMEADGQIEPDVRAIRAAEAVEPDEEEEEGIAPAAGPEEPAPSHMTAEEAIAELRAKIDRIGPVNMMAIEQSKELEERHTFLTGQRQDLIDSIAQTNEAISKIDETTHARFREAFTAINTNFQQTFSTLFGGGRAGLTLLDESDPLESGIDIVASPPGKRLQSVMLLSGGEKALTAIALMFAIFRYKPSPFCLLDEIDAPLDDANIGRFVEMLRSMLDRTQFIVITHNRKTMEIANRLYGVTMEEPGVSKLISIQLN
ncbi:MAG: chromosome segregation protein SMC [Acidobacteria bacterium RIFCSPLOWO2_12_FULL_67_14b]|nr:MAG: chromosome segregation protein SMC [Acidobacteria bacterium RIFCSPLOWO2_12_FULL_67_14b]